MIIEDGLKCTLDYTFPVWSAPNHPSLSVPTRWHASRFFFQIKGFKPIITSRIYWHTFHSSFPAQYLKHQLIIEIRNYLVPRHYFTLELVVEKGKKWKLFSWCLDILVSGDATNFLSYRFQAKQVSRHFYKCLFFLPKCVLLWNLVDLKH